jgi:hypothetical protein
LILFCAFAYIKPSRNCEYYKNNTKKDLSLPQKIMTIQRAHINAELCESPSIKGLFGYDEMIWNEAKCADFGNYLL